MIFFTVAGGLLMAGLGLLLAHRFRQTGNTGYAVLGVPLVLWPFLWIPLTMLLRTQIDRHLAGQTMLWPFSMLDGRSAGEIVAFVGGIRGIVELMLLIFGFIVLGRGDVRPSDAPFNSPLQPTAPSPRAGRDG